MILLSVLHSTFAYSTLLLLLLLLPGSCFSFVLRTFVPSLSSLQATFAFASFSSVKMYGKIWRRYLENVDTNVKCIRYILLYYNKLYPINITIQYNNVYTSCVIMKLDLVGNIRNQSENVLNTAF